MISLEQFGELFVGFLFGLLSGILLSWLKNHSENKRRLKDTPANIVLYATNLRAAILNKETDLDLNVCSLLFNNYNAFCKNKELNDAFTILHIMCSFLKGGGYRDQEHRIVPDIDKIDEIIQRFQP